VADSAAPLGSRLAARNPGKSNTRRDHGWTCNDNALPLEVRSLTHGELVLPASLASTGCNRLSSESLLSLPSAQLPVEMAVSWFK